MTESSEPTKRRGLLRRVVVVMLILASLSCGWGLFYHGYSRRKIAELESATEAAYKAKDWEQLERMALEWFQWQPEIAKPLLFAANAASQRNDAIRQSLYLFNLPDEDPQSVVGLLELSQIQFSVLFDPIAGEATCHRILRIDPKVGESYRRLGFYYAMSRQRARLIGIAREAINQGKETPDSYVYLMGADWLVFSNGRQLNSQWLQSAPTNETFQVAAAIHFTATAAMTETSQGESGREQTEKVMQELLARFPKNIEALALHLNAACYRGQVDQVIQLLEQAPPESATDSRFWTFKGWVHEQREELEEAEKSYLKALELYPYDEKAYHWLAGVYRQTNELKKSAKYEQISVLGTEIKREALQLADTQSLPRELMEKMVKYAAAAGDSQIAKALQTRLNKSSP